MSLQHDHVGHMHYTTLEAWCDSCGQRWYMATDNEDRNLGWRPIR